MEDRQTLNNSAPVNANQVCPGISQICILFSVTIFLFLMIGYRVQKREFYSGILVTEFALILLPALIYLVVFRFDLKKVLRLNKASFLSFFLVFFIMVFAIPVAGLFNVINLWLVNSIFGKIIIEQPPVAQNITEVLVNILVIGGAAGLCEEFLFRGVIQRGLERYGAVKAILLSAFLFGLTHLDFQKLFGTFLLGSLIGFIVYRTNSLYCGMFAHFTNNSLAVLVGYAANKLTSIMKDSGMQLPQTQSDLGNLFSTFTSMPREQLVIIAFVYGFIFLVLFAIFASLVYTFIKTTSIKGAGLQRDMLPAGSHGLLWLLPGVSFIAVMYFVEVLTFKGINSAFTQQLRMLLGV